MGAVVGGGATRVNFDHDSDHLDLARSANFSSFHPGGAQFALADGSVTFIGETIEFDHINQISKDEVVDSVYEQLLSRDDGAVVELE